jgi:diguanylate cyclase (GGDEF)-like protein
VGGGLLERAGVDAEVDEALWRLTANGWRELGASPAIDRRRREAVSRLGILERVGDPALSALVRVASFVAGGTSAAINIFDERYQLRIATAHAPLDVHPAHDAMCRLVVDEGEPIVSTDASTDARFGYSTLVRGPDAVRFYAAVPLRTTDDDAVVGTLCVFDTEAREFDEAHVALLEDLARQVVSQIEFARLAIDLGQLAMHDALTGAVNRLLLHDRLVQAFARRRRHGGEVVVMMVDIDNFKSLNDTYGHAAGDAVLRAVAHRLAESVRVEDTIARIGGDEFAVLTELTGGEDANELGERIRGRIAKPMSVGTAEVVLSISLGVAVADLDEEPSAALARADDAMYESKRSSG